MFQPAGGASRSHGPADGDEIAEVYPDPDDHPVNHDRCFRHRSGTRVRDLHSERRWEQLVRSSFTKRGAAGYLADLHLEVLAAPLAAPLAAATDAAPA